MAAKKNPARIKGKLKTVPKGKRKGQIFTHKGKKYLVVSYTTKTGKRVRYAQAVSKCKSPAKKASCKVKRKTAKAKRKNPFSKQRPTAVSAPSNRRTRGDIFCRRGQKSGHGFQTIAYPGTGGEYVWGRRMTGIKCGGRPTTPKAKVAIPKGKKKGDTFKRGNRTYKVMSMVRNGKRIRYARKA